MKPVHPKMPWATCVAALVALAPLVAASPARGDKTGDDMPLPARLVLREVGPLMDRKAYDEAIAKLTAFRARGGPPPVDGRADPKGYHHPLIDLALGNLYLLKENPGLARAPLRRVVSLLPERVDAWLNLGKACYDTKAYAEAADCFATAYGKDPAKPPQYLFFSAAAHLLDKSFSKAVATYEHLFQAHPKDIQPVWRENFVQALLAADKPRRALPIVRDLAEQSTGPERLRWQESLLHLYLQLDMTKEAGVYAQHLVAEDPTTAKWWKALVHVELSVARYKEALTALTIYAYLEPLTEAESKLWADLNLQLQIPSRAAPVYAQLLEGSPDSQLLEKLVSAYRQMGRYDDALAQLDRHLPDHNPKFLMLRADLLYAARRFGDAAGTYRLAASKDRRVAGQAWLMAGYAAWQLNDLAASRRAFREASRFSGHEQAALQAMRQLEAVN